MNLIKNNLNNRNPQSLISISTTNNLTKKTVDSSIKNLSAKSVLFNKIFSRLTLSLAQNNLNNPKVNTNVSAAANEISKLNSSLAGLNIRLGGRLLVEPIRPRKTVKNYQTGTLARVKVQSIETSRFTGKNKRGTFSFTITISSLINN